MKPPSTAANHALAYDASTNGQPTRGTGPAMLRRLRAYVGLLSQMSRHSGSSPFQPNRCCNPTSADTTTAASTPLSMRVGSCGSLRCCSSHNITAASNNALTTCATLLNPMASGAMSPCAPLFCNGGMIGNPWNSSGSSRAPTTEKVMKASHRRAGRLASPAWNADRSRLTPMHHTTLHASTAAMTRNGVTP